uniref:Uncharacterized protein n=1 Tax=Nelumbo nucifera TaxID=4432 RepID=A0A822XNQ7_NELNU|nr:TPA_asm: hypothetical protein HUJ06_023135 [Nelumbo nucifera]
MLGALAWQVKKNPNKILIVLVSWGDRTGLLPGVSPTGVPFVFSFFL